MSASPNRIFLSRLIGQDVFDSAGDQVGKMRDVVVTIRSAEQHPQVLGLVVEVPGRRRVFLPMTRVTSLDSGQINTSGRPNARRFEQRGGATPVLHELLDRSVLLPDGIRGQVFDVAMEQDSRKSWSISHIAVHENGKRVGRRGHNHIVDWKDVAGLTVEKVSQDAKHLLATMDNMRPADLANALRDLTAKRRMDIVAELSDKHLADVLEELPEKSQVEILGVLDPERAAAVLEEMNPDDAADLIAELPATTAERLLSLMEPGEADDVRRLLSYEEHTAGGMMTTEPVILPPDATLAEALARISDPELSPALAAMVYVCRPPVETPTGRFLGIIDFQALLREPPSTPVGGIVDNDIDWPHPESSLEHVASLLASYDLVALPVIDENQRLVGVVTIDDVLDHLLPKDWRDRHSNGADH